MIRIPAELAAVLELVPAEPEPAAQVVPAAQVAAADNNSETGLRSDRASASAGAFSFGYGIGL